MARTFGQSPMRLVLVLVIAIVAAVGGAATPTPASAAPYRTATFDLAPLGWDQLSWHDDVVPQLPAKPPTDAKGIPMVRWHDGELYYRPGEIAINGMRRVDAWVQSGDEAQLRQALVQARKLRSMADVRRDAWWLPWEFDYPSELQQAPWYNAMSQGLVLSFFVRLHRVTGDSIHLEAATQVFRSFKRLGRERSPWVGYVDGSGYLWLEHYPSQRADHVLNAHLHALFGLHDYWQETGAKGARTLLEGGILTMRDNVSRYRTPGGVSIYCLYHRNPHRKYHAIHIWQLQQLSRISGVDYFAQMAALLEQDYEPDKDGQGKPRS